MEHPKIWIVDNDPIDSQIIKEMLEINELAKDVRLFHSNQEVLEEMNNSSKVPEIIITENRTQQVNGWKLMEVARKKFQNTKNTSFHMVSNALTNTDLRAFKSSNLLKSLSKKPLRLDDLLGMVKD